MNSDENQYAGWKLLCSCRQRPEYQIGLSSKSEGGLRRIANKIVKYQTYEIGDQIYLETNCLNNFFHTLIRLQTAPNWWYEITWFSSDKILFCSVHPCHCAWELNWKTACQGDGAEKSLDFFDKMVSSCLNCLSFKEVRWNLKLPYKRGEAKSHGRFLFNVAPCVKHIKVSLQPGQDQCRLCKNPPSDFSSDATSAMLSGAGPPIGQWPHPCNWFFSYFFKCASISWLQDAVY